MSKKLLEMLKNDGITLSASALNEINRLSSNKKYGLVWEDHPEDVEMELEGGSHTVYEYQDKKLNNDESDVQNMLIEGDNLQGLMYLKEQDVKVDVIYIDPPYNTGNEFVYNDKIVDKEDGYRHSKWLSFMSKRLELARELMIDEGVIFISIDDNEQAQIKLLCDQIFGEENLIANMVWTNKEGGGGSDSKYINTKHEYVLIYSKTDGIREFKGIPVSDEERYKLTDKYEEIRGMHQLIRLESGSLGYVNTLDYPIEAPDGTLIHPNKDGRKVKRWRWSKKKYDWGLENGYVVIKKDRSGDWAVYTKQYLKADNAGNIIDRTRKSMGIIEEFSTTQSNREIKDIFGYKVFDYTKPTGLVKYLIGRVNNPNAFVLDFFAGSGTTAQAVMELNEEDGGNRQFILMTNNEVSTKDTFKLAIKDDKTKQLLLDNDISLKEHKGTDSTAVNEQRNKDIENFFENGDGKDFFNSDMVQDEGICRKVTYERIRRVAEGDYASGKKVESLPINLKYIRLGIENNPSFLKERSLLHKQNIIGLSIKHSLTSELESNDVYILKNNDKTLAYVAKETLDSEDINYLVENGITSTTDVHSLSGLHNDRELYHKLEEI